VFLGDGWTRVSKTLDPADWSVTCAFGRAPRIENGLNVGPHLSASLGARDSGHEESVIVCITVPHHAHDGERHGVGMKRPAGCAPADSSAPSGSRMGRDVLGSLRRTAREETNDLLTKRVLEGVVLKRPVLDLAKAASRSCLFVGQTACFRLGECLFLDENPLTLVATP